MTRLRSTVFLAMAACLFAPPGPGRASAQASKVGAVTAIIEPVTRQVVQRRDDNIGDILIVGVFSGSADGFQAQSTLSAGMNGTPQGWGPLIDVTIYENYFVGIYRQAAGGFYNLQVRPVFAGQAGGSSAVSMVGVGEVFITAGQSNTTNFGDPTGFYPGALVSCFDPGTARGIDPSFPGAFWRWGYDPQPAIDDSTMGSVWPTMGNNLSIALGVPIGMYAVGFGGTSIQDWTPGFLLPATLVTPKLVLFDRLTNAINHFNVRGGARAVLWMQGETDFEYQTNPFLYELQLRQVINQSRAVTGVPIKWMIAQSSSCQLTNVNERIGLEIAQSSVVDNILTFQGPDADLIGVEYRKYLGGLPVHFNAMGLELLGGLWGLYVANTPGFLFGGDLPRP